MSGVRKFASMIRVRLIDPLERLDVIVPDARPLIYLAQAGVLHLLHRVGRAVILVDVVVNEVTREPGKPGAELLRRWIEDGMRRVIEGQASTANPQILVSSQRRPS